MANRDTGVIGEQNPVVYKQLMEEMKNQFVSKGMDLGDDFYKSFVKSRYASTAGFKDLVNNLDRIAAEGSSMSWFQGTPLSREQFKTAAFNAKAKGKDLRTRFDKAFGVRSSFLASDQEDPSLTRNVRGQLTNPLMG
jgi:hypothetical protein